MENVHILGGHHGGSDGAQKGLETYTQLFDTESDEHFKEWFESFDEKSTLLICEGRFHPDVLTNGHNLYDTYLKNVSIALYKSDFDPDCLYPDSRKRYERERIRINQAYLKLSAWCRQYATMVSQLADRIPRNTEQMVEAIWSGFFDPWVFFIESLDPTIKAVAQTCIDANQSVENSLLSNAEKYSKEYDQVLIVCGLVHAVNISKHSGRPYTPLVEANSKTAADRLFKEMLLIQVIPNLIVK